jgi:hypothetical protein
LNWPLLRFLARRRGPLFALRAAPVNLLAHFYSGIAFGICVAVHPLRRVAPGYAGRDVQTGPL